jgi:hypothetical protein
MVKLLLYYTHLQGNDVDPCYDTTFWRTFLSRYPAGRNYSSTYDIRAYRSFFPQFEIEALLSDMCGWRMVAKRSFLGAGQDATRATLRVRMCSCGFHVDCFHWIPSRVRTEVELCLYNPTFASITSSVQPACLLGQHT